MRELKDEIMYSLLHQPGILACMLRKHTLLRATLAAWFVGEKPVLLIGGEPGMGKSLFMGDLTLHYERLACQHSALPRPLALISYDRVHFLFLKSLADRLQPGWHSFLPEGETHPEARKWISRLLQEVVFYATQRLGAGTRILLEAPLIGQRGENLLQPFPDVRWKRQVVILHSPAMRDELLDQKSVRGTSAHTSAMRQIRDRLLHQRAILPGEQEPDQALEGSWRTWLQKYDGCLLTWNPHEDHASYTHTRTMLREYKIATDPLLPELLYEQTLRQIEHILECLPDPRALANLLSIPSHSMLNIAECFVPRIRSYAAHSPPVL